jgi:hypothetical protein
MYHGTYLRMYNSRKPSIRRITANLPAQLLKSACSVTGAGVTETLVRGLELVRRSAAVKKARMLKGKLHLDIDIETSRERAHY